MRIKYKLSRFLATIFSAAACVTAPLSGFSQEAGSDVDYANRLSLAHVKSVSSKVNADARFGLKKLSDFIKLKTVVTPSDVVSIDIESDDLTFFPFLYWPVKSYPKTLSAEAQKKVQAYINNGGVILFDTHAAGDNQMTALKTMLGDVQIKALTRLPENHALKRTFYLVTDMKAAAQNKPLWVEIPDGDNLENISSVIIGDTGWSEIWAGKSYGANPDDREQALRIGMNIVLYSLTGNYKKSQTHDGAVQEKIELRK